MNAQHLAIYGALAANLAIAIVKFIAAFATGSSAMISEGIHSVVDTGNELLLLLGLRRSKLPPNDVHHFGHEREIFFWSLIVAVLIFGIGGGMSFYEGIRHLRHPVALKDPHWNYVVLISSFIFELISFVIGIRAFKQANPTHRTFFQNLKLSKDPALFVVLYEDFAALLGLVIALGGVYLTHQTGDSRYDGASSVIIGVVLAVVAIILIIESRRLLIGVSAGSDIDDGIRTLLKEDPSIAEVRVLKTVHLGPNYISLALKLVFEGGNVTEEIRRLEIKILEEFADVKEIYMEPVRD